jgi:hypothetical protein
VALGKLIAQRLREEAGFREPQGLQADDERSEAPQTRDNTGIDEGQSVIDNATSKPGPEEKPDDPRNLAAEMGVWSR